MFHFQLFGFDIRVRWMHFVIAALLTVPQGDALAGAERMLLWGVSIVIVFLSVLVHELGHASMARSFGAEAHIFLYEMGGMTTFQHNRPFGTMKLILITLAGPVMGLVVGAGLVGLKTLAGDLPPLQAAMFNVALLVNIGWSLLNLMPINPLDGGHLTRLVLNLATQGKGALLSAIVSAVAGTALAIAFGATQFFFAAVFFAVLAVQNMRAVWTFRDTLFDDRFARPIEAITKRLANGATEEVQSDIAALLLEVKSPEMRSRVRELECWCAIAEDRLDDALRAAAAFDDGEGPSPDLEAALEAHHGDPHKALDHFGLTPRDDIAPFVMRTHLLAALRSREVDSVRALIAAYKDALDPVALVSQGDRFLDEGFHFLGAYLGEQAYALRPTPDAARVAALGHVAQASLGEALAWLERGCRLARQHSAFGWIAETLADERFAAVQGRPRFDALSLSDDEIVAPPAVADAN